MSTESKAELVVRSREGSRGKDTDRGSVSLSVNLCLTVKYKDDQIGNPESQGTGAACNPKRQFRVLLLSNGTGQGKLVIVLSISPSTERRSSAHLVVRTTNGSHQVPRLVSPCTWKTGAFVTNADGRFILTSSY